MSKKLISFVVPVYNEEKNIPRLLKELDAFSKTQKKYDFEFVLVENGSVDSSFSLLKKAAVKDKRIKLLQLSRNFGCDGGITAGLSQAKGQAAVIMMADLQEPISLVSDFIKKWEEGYEIVYGIVRKRTGGFVRNQCSRLFYRVINMLTGNMFPKNASDFRLIDRKVYETLNLMEEKNRYLRGLIIWTGFKQTGIPFDRKDRYAGESKAHFFTVLNVAVNGIFSFSYLPLRLVTALGLLVTVVSVIMIIVYLTMFFTLNRVIPGFTTVILLLLFLFGTLFFILGIISEYLAKIYDEVKKRPNFIVKEKINIS